LLTTNQKELPKKLLESHSDSGLELNSLASEGKMMFYIRSKVQQNTNQSILRLEGVNDRSGAQYYFGKRVAYIYKTKSGQKDKRFRVIIY
jgi:large subunit ribosomal protein L35Ae